MRYGNRYEHKKYPHRCRKGKGVTTDRAGHTYYTGSVCLLHRTIVFINRLNKSHVKTHNPLMQEPVCTSLSWQSEI